MFLLYKGGRQIKALIRYFRWQVVSYCGLIITLTIFMVHSTVYAQDDYDLYPVGPGLDGATDLVEIINGETAERPTKQETQPLTADLNSDQSILPDPPPTVPKYLAELILGPLPETPTQPHLPVAMPDLIVGDIWSTTPPLQSGQEENVTFLIRNQGTVGIDTTFWIRLFLDGVPYGPWEHWEWLGPGQATQKWTTVTVASDGFHQVEIEVDIYHDIPESNDSNNTRTETWFWEIGPGDLIVEDIWSTTPPLQAGQEENVTVRIKNQGKANIPTVFYLRILIDGVSIVSWPSGGLLAGEDVETTTTVIVDSDGFHQVEIEVDFDDRIVETNEGNNSRTETWFWETSPIDLVVDDVWSTTEPLETCSVETIKLQIRNQGTEAVEGIYDTRFSIGGFYAGIVQTDGLAAGAASVKTIDIRIDDPGVHEVRVIVDSGVVIIEGDEANNELVENWEWIGEKWYQLVLPLTLR